MDKRCQTEVWEEGSDQTEEGAGCLWSKVGTNHEEEKTPGKERMQEAEDDAVNWLVLPRELEWKTDLRKEQQRTQSAETKNTMAEIGENW